MCDSDLWKQHYVTEAHPAHFYAYLKRRKHILIPTILTEEDMLCDMAYLTSDKKSPSESVAVKRGNYARQNFMMSYPYRTINDLMLNNIVWSKFVQGDGLTLYTPKMANWEPATVCEKQHISEKRVGTFSKIIKWDKSWNVIWVDRQNQVQFQTTKPKSIGRRTRKSQYQQGLLHER